MDNKRPDLPLEPGRCFIRDRPAEGVVIRLINGYDTVYGVKSWRWRMACLSDFARIPTSIT
jgi:hypothetical protein